jgi:hypothetical protein
MARQIATVSRDVREYTPKDWLDENEEPELSALKFKFKPLSKKQLATFSDSSTRLQISTNSIMLGNAENMINIFRVAVVGFENLIVDEQPVPFKKDTAGLVHEDIVELLPLDIIEEVGNHIVLVSKASEEVLKK